MNKQEINKLKELEEYYYLLLQEISSQKVEVLLQVKQNMEHFLPSIDTIKHPAYYTVCQTALRIYQEICRILNLPEILK